MDEEIDLMEISGDVMAIPTHKRGHGLAEPYSAGLKQLAIILASQPYNFSKDRAGGQCMFQQAAVVQNPFYARQAVCENACF